MAKGRRSENWNHTSHVLWMIYNAHRSKDDKELTPAALNPMIEKRRYVATQDELHMIRDGLLEMKGQKTP